MVAEITVPDVVRLMGEINRGMDGKRLGDWFSERGLEFPTLDFLDDIIKDAMMTELIETLDPAKAVFKHFLLVLMAGWELRDQFGGRE